MSVRLFVCPFVCPNTSEHHPMSAFVCPFVCPNTYLYSWGTSLSRRAREMPPKAAISRVLKCKYVITNNEIHATAAKVGTFVIVRHGLDEMARCTRSLMVHKYLHTHKVSYSIKLCS